MCTVLFKNVLYPNSTNLFRGFGKLLLCGNPPSLDVLGLLCLVLYLDEELIDADRILNLVLWATACYKILGGLWNIPEVSYQALQSLRLLGQIQEVSYQALCIFWFSTFSVLSGFKGGCTVCYWWVLDRMFMNYRIFEISWTTLYAANSDQNHTFSNSGFKV